MGKIKKSIDEQIESKHSPAWVKEFKKDCYNKLAAVAYPSVANEAFKFSKILDVDLDEFETDFEPKNAGLNDVEKFLADLGYLDLQNLIEDSSAVAIVSDGVVSEVINKFGSKVSICNSADELPDFVTELRLGESAGYFDLLHGCLTSDLLCICTDRNIEATGIVTVINVISAKKAIVAPTVVVNTSENSSLNVVEIFISENNDSYVLPVDLLNLGRNSRCAFVRYQLLSTSNIFSGLQLSNHDLGSSLNTLNISLGGEIARMRIDSVLSGDGSQSDLASVSHGRFNQKLDLRTKQDHIGKRTESNMISATVLGGEAESVTTGLVKMRKGSKKARAVQSNKNLLVTPGAHAESEPNLDILENDVRCDHASSVGPINLEQLHFLESRGVEPAVAKKLVIKGYLNSVMDTLKPTNVPSEAVRVAKSLIHKLPD